MRVANWAGGTAVSLGGFRTHMIAAAPLVTDRSTTRPSSPHKLVTAVRTCSVYDCRSSTGHRKGNFVLILDAVPIPTVAADAIIIIIIHCIPDPPIFLHRHDISCVIKMMRVRAVKKAETPRLQPTNTSDATQPEPQCMRHGTARWPTLHSHHFLTPCGSCAWRAPSTPSKREQSCRQCQDQCR